MGSGPISLLKIHEDFPQLRILHITVIIMDQLTQCSLRSISAADPSSSSLLLLLLHVLVFVHVRYARHGRNVLIRRGMEGAEILPRSVGLSVGRARASLPAKRPISLEILPRICHGRITRESVERRGVVSPPVQSRKRTRCTCG